MYEFITEQVTKKLIDDLKEVFRQIYMERHNHDIHYKACSWRSPYSNYDQNKDYYTRWYQKRFQEKFWPNLKIEEFIEKCNAEDILDQFFKRHPWLRIERSDSEKIPYKFLYYYLNKRLRCSFKEPYDHQNKVNWQHIRDFDSRTKVSPAIIEHFTTIEINNFPINPNNSDAYNENRDEYPNLCNTAITYNTRPTRIDLYRFLSRGYPCGIIQYENLLWPDRLPVHHSDLEHLSEAYVSQIKLLIINLETEEFPLWIAYEIETSTAYIPKFLEKDKINSVQRRFAGLTIKTVSYQKNDHMEHRFSLDDVAKWHGVLLSRILPWIYLTPPKPPLEKYREDAPILLLIQAGLERCLVHPGGWRKKDDLMSEWILQCSTWVKKKSDLDALLGDDTNDYQLQLNNTGELLAQFETSFKFSDDKKTFITTESVLDKTNLTRAFFIAAHTKANRWAISSRSTPNSLHRKLADYNSDLKTILFSRDAAHSASFGFLVDCAARNRFLSAVNPSVFHDPVLLWLNAGREMVKFFQDKTLSLLDIKECTRILPVWRESCCDHKQETTVAPTLWSFLQISQMGLTGVNYLFFALERWHILKWDASLKTESPQLAAIFDLNGSLIDDPLTYVAYLIKKIRTSSTSQLKDMPLFRSLSLILPYQFTEEAFYTKYVPQLKELIHLVQTRHQSIGDVGEIRFYNLKYPCKTSNRWMKYLQDMADEEKVFISIVFPQLDVEFKSNLEYGELKADYKALQNKLANNQRERMAMQLTEAIRNLSYAKKGILMPQIIINEDKGTKPQPWYDADVTYPLTAKTGIQMQMQMEQQLEEATEQEKKEEQQDSEIAKKIEIPYYTGREAELIGPEEYKALYGDELFDWIVGGSAKAAHSIGKMERAAIEKLRPYASALRMGLVPEPDRLRPGFRLAYSMVDKKLILCFSAQQERADLAEKAKGEQKQQNPFVLSLEDPRPAAALIGDYRQFALFSSDPNKQQTLWQHLTPMSHDLKAVESAIQCLQSYSARYRDIPDEALSIMQWFDLNNRVHQPGSYEQALDYLLEWAGRHIHDEHFLRLLFHKDSPSVLSPQNLRALGQIFNTFDCSLASKSNASSGSQALFSMAFELYDAFGAENMSIWKRSLLDPRENGSDLLDKEEVDAVALSIVSLKKNPHYQTLWWSLVEAHAKAVGYMRYAPLWYSFQAFIDYVEGNHLRIPLQAWRHVMQNNELFNGQVFLDRLLTVLKKASTQLEATKISQAVLDQMDHISWKQGDFYYANRYENYFYYADNLHLAGFADAENKESPSYRVTWGNTEKPKVTALRFASQRMQLTFSQYEKVSQILTEAFPDDLGSSLAQRLLMVCLSLGIDRVESLHAGEIKTTIRQLNQLDPHLIGRFNALFDLDGELSPSTLQLRFEDWVIFAKLIKAQAIEMPSIKLINACGRAINCLKRVPQKRKGQTIHIETLLGEFNLKDENNLPSLLTDYPWLISSQSRKKYQVDPAKAAYQQAHDEEIKQQLGIFQEQLRSIDCSNSPFLPSHAQLFTAFQTIATAKSPEDAKKARRKIIQQWWSKDCNVTYLDTPFRPLKSVEQENARDYFLSYITPTFSQQNELLFKRLISTNIAVNAERDVKQEMEQLISIFLQIGTQENYNELGQVLGLLLEKAAQPRRYYSASQLKDWLTCILKKSTLENKHYPVDLLNNILTDAVKKPHCPWFNTQLHRLGEGKVDQKVQEKIKNIVSLEMPHVFKSTLIKLVFLCQHNPDYVQYVQNKFSLLQEKEYPVDCMAGISQLVLGGAVISPSPSVHLNPTHHPNPLPNPLPLGGEGIRSGGPVVNAALGMSSVSTGFSDLKAAIERLTQVFYQENTDLAALWGNAQLQWMRWINRGVISLKRYNQYVHIDTESKRYIYMILTQALSNQAVNSNKLYTLQKLLSAWSEDNLKALALYYRSEPHLPDTLLFKMLDNPSVNSISEFIHQFEAVERGLDEKGSPKRHYSVSEKDRVNLMRVLGGIKRKGKGHLSDEEQKKLLNLLFYANHYSQVAELHQLPWEELKNALHKARAEMNKSRYPDQASARLLACMREILLRKSGKWVNHTQMLDLLYAAKHNEDSLLHQVRTGEGKSIITVMRAAYLALNGSIVDIFSSKESLSERDQAEFSPILAAMDIRHSYIHANSAVEDYQYRVNEQGLGAVNYATLGNFSLFLSRHIWEGQQELALHNEHRVAFLDEADYILADEHTLFNSVDTGGTQAIYNFDTWVYQVAYDYYLEQANEFNSTQTISRNKHLKALCERLQAHIESSPKQSSFFHDYIIPALEGDAEAMKQRDFQLKLLLSAAHAAHSLKAGVDFCVKPESKKLSNGVIMEGRAAKVLIKNQIKEGSTFSELVQQFLHVRLNKEATQQYQTPNFFVEPYTPIALSQNAAYVLNKYYNKLEGCTGTPGNAAALAYYEKHYGIDQVVKLPTHEPSRTRHLPAVYADSEADQLDVIVDNILAHSNMPILITCKDDIEVKRFAALLGNRLKKYKYPLDKWIIDTNDSGKKESDVLPKVGQVGAVTISSRMGRGTDIKPATAAGLMVMRTYPASPRVIKQERGRQGRHGGLGICQDIIHFEKEKRQYEYYRAHYPDRIDTLMASQIAHLDIKLKKSKWAWLAKNPALKEKYLITRVTEEWKEALQAEEEKYIRQKENYSVYLSGIIMDALQSHFEDKTLSAALKKSWLRCKKHIDEAWNVRLAGKVSDNDEVYEHFLQVANSHWNKLVNDYPALKKIKPIIKKGQTAHLTHPVSHTQHQEDDMVDLTEFYQTFIQSMDDHILSDPPAHPGIQEAIYGTVDEEGDYQKSAALFRAIEAASIQQDKKKDTTLRRHQLFQCLLALIKSPCAACIHCSAWAEVVNKLMGREDEKEHEHYLASLSSFFTIPWLKDRDPKQQDPQEIAKISRLLTLVVSIYTTRNHNDHERTLKCIQNLGQVMHEPIFWDNFLAFADDFESLFTAHSAITDSFILSSNSENWYHLAQLVQQNSVEKNSYSEVNQERLKAYLVEHVETLKQQKYHKLFSPLFEISLARRRYNDSDYFLPSPDCLNDITPEQQRNFWHFLTQRPSIPQKSTKLLIEKLNASKKNKSWNKMFRALVKLPPYLTLDYLVTHVQHALVEEVTDEAQERLKTIGDAASQLNTFLRKHKIIQEGDAFKPILNQMSFDNWMNIFNQMPPETNKILFDKLEKTNLPLEILQFIAASFAENKISSLDLLEKALICAKKGQKILPFTEEKQDKRIIQLINAFAIVSPPPHPNPLPQGGGGIRMGESMTTDEALENAFIRMQQFIDIFCAKMKTDSEKYQKETIETLFKAYCIDHTIKDYSQLITTFEILNEARQIEADKSHDALFDSFSKNRSRRLQIMQQLEHGLLNLGESVTQHYYKKYRQFALKHAQKNTRASDKAVFKSLRDLNQILHEMALISAPLYETKTEEKSAIGSVEWQHRWLEKEIARHKQNYLGGWGWGISQDRKIAANTFFEEMKKGHGLAVSLKNYYSQKFQAIFTLQDNISVSDGVAKETGAARNVLGYSRLHKISIDLFITVARDFINDQKLTHKDKKEIVALWQAQLKIHCKRLHDRLCLYKHKPEYTFLKQVLHDTMSHSEVSATQLERLIKTLHTEKKNIPRPLRYLEEMLQCFLIAPEISSAQASQVLQPGNK